MFVVSILADLESLSIKIDEEGNEYIPLPYFEGGQDDNLVFVTASNATILTEKGNDVAIAYLGSEFFFGDEGNDVLIGGSGNDLLVGGLRS